MSQIVQTMPDSLAAEIRDLAARRDIADAVQRYMRGLDRLDRDLLLSAFFEDAEIDCGLMQGGPAAFADFALDLLGAMEATHHLLGQIRVELSGESALGECYFQAYHDTRDEAGKPGDLFIAGRYVDEYACRNGEWRIARRTLVTDWVSEATGSRDFFVQNPTAPRGARRGADLSQTRSR